MFPRSLLLSTLEQRRLSYVQANDSASHYAPVGVVAKRIAKASFFTMSALVLRAFSRIAGYAVVKVLRRGNLHPEKNPFTPLPKKQGGVRKSIQIFFYFFQSFLQSIMHRHCWDAFFFGIFAKGHSRKIYLLNGFPFLIRELRHCFGQPV